MVIDERGFFLPATAVASSSEAKAGARGSEKIGLRLSFGCGGGVPRENITYRVRP